MPGNIGLPEILIVLIIALIVFGPKRLPELGRSLGKGIREFRGSLSGDSDDDEQPSRQEPPVPPEKPLPPPEIEAATGEPVAPEQGEPIAHKRP
jgi:TatA/E family protein of Tat protein translocase